VVIGLAEETGWRGFALPRLQQWRGPLVGTAVLAVVWAMWHLPNVLFGGWTGASYALWLVVTIASAFVYTWLFNNTAGSILLAALLHAAINMSSGLVLDLVPGIEDAFYVQLYGAGAIAFVTVALVLVAATRGRLGYRAQETPREAPTRT
jgi:membrane protease YdiL (CAAX protease family)